MKCNIIDELGVLAIGSRMRRLYDRLSKDTARIYEDHKLEFEIQYFTLFYLISKRKQIGIMDIAQELSMTHPAIIHLAKGLEKKGYIASVNDANDNRKRNLKLSAKGKKALPEFEKVWRKLKALNEQLFIELNPLLKTMEAVEQTLEEKSYYKRYQSVSNGHPLDNPCWNALETVHERFAIGDEKSKRYPAHLLPFMGYDAADGSPMDKIERFVEPGETLFIVGDLPVLPANWAVIAKLDCLQMVCHSAVHFTQKDQEIVRLNEADAEEMFAFINRIQPGYFKKDTHLLGNYYGIRIDGKLVAMAGERLKMTGYHEISAVCTDPDFTGKGLANYLITYLCSEIQKTGDLPFLHVLDTNSRAIRLYEFLGFETRRAIPFWKLKFAD